jgi:hypothetical protein
MYLHKTDLLDDGRIDTTRNIRARVSRTKRGFTGIGCISTRRTFRPCTKLKPGIILDMAAEVPNSIQDPSVLDVYNPI